MPDGVANSARTVAAVPGIIGGVRRHGYCLTVIGRHGQPADPRPRVRVRRVRVNEQNSGTTVVRIPVRLTSRAVRTVRFGVHAADGSAKKRKDFAPLHGTATVRHGRRRGAIRERIINDRRHERTERFRVRLNHVHSALLSGHSVRVTVRDNDPAPTARRR